MKRKPHVYRVIAQGFDESITAKSVGNAIHKFRSNHNDGTKKHVLTLITDRDSGGWQGVSVDLLR